MAIRYQLLPDFLGKPQTCIRRINEDGSITVIPFAADNSSYAEYKLWLDAGNTPEAAD